MKGHGAYYLVLTFLILLAFYNTSIFLDKIKGKEIIHLPDLAEFSIEKTSQDFVVYCNGKRSYNTSIELPPLRDKDIPDYSWAFPSLDADNLEEDLSNIISSNGLPCVVVEVIDYLNSSCDSSKKFVLECDDAYRAFPEGIRKGKIRLVGFV